MHVSRIACLLLGAWIGGSLFMSAVATQNFQSVTRTLGQAEPEVAEAVKLLGGPDAARVFLRYHVGEQNRFYFEAWEWVQIGVGCILFTLLLFGSHERKRVIALSVLMLALVLVMRVWVTPSITALSREMDFMPAARESPIRSQFRAWHTAYAVIEMVKLGTGLLVGILLVTGNGRRRPSHDAELQYSAPGYRR